jgi:hypothetical protein
LTGLNFPDYETGGTEWDDLGGGSVDGSLGGTFGLLLGMDFGLLIGEAEVLLSFDNAYTEIQTSNYGGWKMIRMNGIALHIPLLAKMDFHLGPVVFQPLLGPYFNIALGDLSMSGDGDANDPYANPLFGLVFGGLAGLNLGRGILFLDGRYEMDLGRTVAGNDPITIWKRSALVLSLGYQVYLGRRK